MAVVSAGFPLAATATAQSTDASSHDGKTSVEQVCNAPQAGEVGCFAMRRTDVGEAEGVLPAAATPRGWGASDLQSAYNLPSDGGAGRTVAIVAAYDAPTAEADLAVYRAQYGLPECTTANGCFRKVDQRGGTNYPAAHAGWAGEISLDLDMVSAAAPGAHILLVEADSTTFEDIGVAVDQAVALGAKYVSNSYGTLYNSVPGSGEAPSEVTVLDAHYNHPGVAMVAASGDSGYGVSYPAASQYVTAVGGTALQKDTTTARGWSESVWYSSYGGPGSGCSAYEPKPAFQTDTGCDMRSVADVAAVADPATGVSVYQTYGGSGWGVYGGTSAATPIIAGVYAAAGSPVAGTYPNSYPYLTPSALNDVTSGVNGTCSPSYLCTAGVGYDGPTGLGTPNGLAAFRGGPHGEVSGTVTDAGGAPLAGAAVAAGNLKTTTGADGRYSMTLPAGTYDVTASVYGYHSETAAAVTVTDGSSLTQSFTLEAMARQSVTGKVTDGSGHGWPLYATVTVEGVPGAPVHTDPYTGTYELQLPEGKDYTLKIAAAYPGYQAVSRDITVGTSARTVNIAVPVDADAATVAGYELKDTGSTESFDSTTAAPKGWSVVNAPDTVGGWEFSDSGKRGNRTGGSGAFAAVDSWHIGVGKHQDSSLLSPVYDFSSSASPRITFDTAYLSYDGQSAGVDVTTDGGATWTSLWQRTTTLTRPTHVEIPLTDYADAPAVQLRFHFIGTFGYWWQVDNIAVVKRAAVPLSGGLVVGTVSDVNTGKGVNGATVTNADAPGQSAVTAATPDDPQLGDGFYSLFSDTVGGHSFTAVKSKYASGAKTVKVAADSAAEADYTLKAGQLAITPASVDKTLAWGATGTQKLTVKNTGGVPATFALGERPGGFQIQAAQGAPLQRVEGDYSPLPAAVQAGAAGKAATDAAVPSAAAEDAWQPVADLPVTVYDNAVAAAGGKLYSAFGATDTEITSDMYAYDRNSGSWSQLASAATPRTAPAAGFINGKFYAVGGWDAISASPVAKLEIYDPASNSWTTGASSPKPYGGSGSAVLNGKLYVIGGCTGVGCTAIRDAYAYDASTNSWSAIASYPEPIAWNACGGINGVLYCAGGTNGKSSVKHSYAYDPTTDSWSQIADLPVDVWGSAYTAANGLLLISGGVVNQSSAITNQGFAFDPAAGTWSALPNANAASYRGGGAPGLYRVGGLTGPWDPPVATVEVLPGYDQAGGNADVTWLALDTQQVTLAPGASTTVVVTLDASAAEITQPGAYAAKLSVTTDTPYPISPIPVTLHVDPPKAWGKYAGTVLGSDGAGGTVPLAGATVQIDSRTSSYMLKTGKDGTYALWLDARGTPLTVNVAKDGYQEVVTRVKLVKGATTTGNFTLQKAP